VHGQKTLEAGVSPQEKYIMKPQLSRLILSLGLAALLFISFGCGGGSTSTGGGGGTTAPQNGSVTTTISDASTEDWATIGVKVLSITLTPQGGGSAVTVYTAPTPAPMLNLVQLDQLSEILNNATVAAGTYTSATVTISANPGDVLLTASAEPSLSFAGTAGSSVAPSQIEIVGATGSSGSLTVPVTVNFVKPLTVTANQTSALDIEFDLSHPAFLVAQVPLSGSTVWAINFNGPVRQNPVTVLSGILLRHLYGTVSAVSSDNSSLTITRDFPTEPPVSPETAVSTSENLTITADATNGTLFYDDDAKTTATIKDFSSIASTIDGKFVRIAARYQTGGALVAVRVWASSSFNTVWFSPEGHVLHVDTNTNTLNVLNELGVGVPLTVDANTQFFFRTPANAQADSTPIGTGTAFLANMVRGFKVHASVVDPLATPLVAQTVDIEIARFDGSISAASTTGFTYTRHFLHAADDYTITLPFISSGTANGNDPVSGASITGYKWWNFTYPTQVDSGANAISDFDNATNGSANFGGTAGLFPAAGETFATWNDSANPNGWSAPWTVLLPTTVPVGLAATAYSNGSFTMTVPGGANAVTVNLGTAAGSGTLVYEIDRTGNVITINSVDVTTSAGQTTVTNNLTANVPVKVFGIPQADGSIKAYVLFYYTGTKPAATS
jgi:uncharacterized protein DUF4382